MTQRTIEPYRDQTLPERFLRWIETIRIRFKTIPNYTESDGSPEGVIFGQKADRYYDLTADEVYIKTTQGGNTGWVLITTGGTDVTFQGFGQWRYRTTTSGTPAAGRLEFDNLDINLATEMYLNVTNDNGVDMSAFLALIQANDLVYVQISNDASQYVVIQTDTPTLAASVYTFPILLAEGVGGAPSNNTPVTVVTASAGGGGGGNVVDGTVDGQVVLWDQTTDLQYEPSIQLQIREDNTAGGNVYFSGQLGARDFIHWSSTDGGNVHIVEPTLRMDSMGGVLGSGHIKWFSSGGGRADSYVDHSNIWYFENEGGGGSVTHAYYKMAIAIDAGKPAPAVVLGDASVLWSYQYNANAGPVLMTHNEDAISFPVGAPRDQVWTFNSPTAAADPGLYFMRMDTADFATAGSFYFDDTSALDADAGWWFDALAVGDILLMTTGVDRDRWCWALVDAITDNGSWWTIDFTALDHSGTNFINADDVRISVQRQSLASGIADGTFTGNHLYWNGSVWVEYGNIFSVGGITYVKDTLNVATGALLRVSSPSDTVYHTTQIDNFGTLDLRIQGVANGGYRFRDRPVYMEERAAAGGNFPTYGQWWTRNDANQTPMFTDEAGTSYALNESGLPVSSAEGELLVGDGAGGWREVYGVLMAATATPPITDEGFITLQSTATTDPRRPQIFAEVVSTQSVFAFWETSATNGFFLRVVGNGADRIAFGREVASVDSDMLSIREDGSIRTESGAAFYLTTQGAAATDYAGWGQLWNRFADDLLMWTDENGTDQVVDPSISELNVQNGNYTLLIGDKGKTIAKQSGGAGETITIPANASVAYEIGTWVAFDNDGGGDLTIAITTDTLEGTDGVTGSRTLGDNERAMIQKITATKWRYQATDL